MLRMQQQTTAFGSYTDVDLEAIGAGNFKLSIGYSHASQLTWTVNAAQHSTPIPRLAFIRFWDEGEKLADGTTDQDEDHPLFEGFVEVVDPGGESLTVNYTAFDPTYRTARELVVMSQPWEAGDPEADPPEPPTEGIGAIPRLVLNCKNDADDDYAFERAHDGTVGQFIAGILEDAQEPLFWRNAAPADELDPFVSALPYVWTGEVADMTFKPQEKLVWESESVRAGLARLERYEPRYRLLWEPGTRLWRFKNLTASATKTLTLNEADLPHPVESLELQPVMEDCYTALKIYGPPATETEEFVWYHPDHEPPSWPGNTLTPSDEVVLQTIGMDEIVSYSTWQIDDTTKRRGARLLPEWQQVEVGSFTDPKIPYEWLPIKKPTLLLTWDDTTWTACAGVWFDTNAGKAIFNGTSPYCHSTDARGQGTGLSGQAYFPPVGVKLVWAYYTTPLSVRVPETGFEGTAYTVAGLEVEKKVYDESLAVGYEYGQPVTTETRTEQMTLYAQSLLDHAKNIRWSGGAQLRRLDYSVCRLDRRINFDVADGAGGTLTTGWESINAFLTDVVYDWENLTTTLTFSSDSLEMIGEDPAQLRERLGIRALQQRLTATQTNIFRTAVGWRGNEIKIWSGLKETLDYVYDDKVTGATYT